ncbi:MAG: CoA ester lyase [Proteobacteria bacterium]|nr:MAG: CoA ester lyase [Pseudomonadota bacterium]
MTNTNAYPGWRSLLFIPVHIDKFVDKAHTRGADAYILDLEDSVPLAEKEIGRQKVKEAAKKVSVDGASALVRINLELEMALLDIEASIDPNVAAIVVPKVENTGQISAIAGAIDRQEQKLGMETGHTKLIAMIESVEALPHLDNIALSHPRVIAMTLGSEDFSASAGMSPIPATLQQPNQMVVFACRRAGIEPLGFPGSIADYSDLNRFEATIELAKQMGFTGALCIHPVQARVLNEKLTPSEQEVSHARGLIEAFDQGMAEGRGAVEYGGKMIDLPVVISARKLVARYEHLQKNAK